ncbi:ATP-binding protein [Variovorax sp. HJSM1_2]|uniref:sensor histidine kinase n=1 Tax=Variovorax sp. HJSM1_2 TaxID=3366263 RepID=UPI003BE12D5E
MLLQFFFWVVGKEPCFGWYILYSMVIFFANLLNTGYPQNLFDWGAPTSFALMGAYVCLAPAVMVRMTVVWLELEPQLPLLCKIYQAVAYTICAATALLVLSGRYTLGLQLNQIGALAWILISLALGTYIWLVRKQAKGWQYLLVFLFVDVGISVRFARNIGLLPSTVLTDYAIFIGVALHMTAMSLFFIYTYSSLREALRVEQRAREEQRDFVSMVSHEFRTPLAIISTSAQQLASNPFAPMSKVQRRAQNIRSATLRLSQLLDEYLSLERLDTAHQALTLRSADFYEVIEEVAADWDIDKINIQIKDLPTPFVCDHKLMRIVLRNLLANGIRHSPPQARIDLRVSGTAKGALHIEVEDHGCGIPADELPKLFQKFFRGRAAQGAPGAGLGLYLVKRVIELHGGTITVKSEPKLGTLFVIDLPKLQWNGSINQTYEPPASAGRKNHPGF